MEFEKNFSKTHFGFRIIFSKNKEMKTKNIFTKVHCSQKTLKTQGLNSKECKPHE